MKASGLRLVSGLAVIIAALLGSWESATSAPPGLAGKYAFSLSGVAVVPPGVEVSVAVLGQFSVDSAGRISGSRVLVVNGQAPAVGTITCTMTSLDANGVGELICDVVDAGSAVRDFYRFALGSRGQEIRLLFLRSEVGGFPVFTGAISGSAIAQ